MIMTVFVQFPDCLLVKIISKWIHLKELAGLDSAFCNKKHRSSLLSLIANPMNTFSSWDYDEINYLAWVCQRDLKLNFVYISGDSVSFLNKTRHINFTKINSLHLSYCQTLSQASLVKIFNGCPKFRLIQMNCVGAFTDKVVKQIRPEIMCEINSWDFNQCPGITGTFMKHISANPCKSLLMLHFRYDDSYKPKKAVQKTRTADLFRIIPSHPYLIMVMLRFSHIFQESDQLIELVTVKCPHLLQFDLTNCVVPSMSVLSRMINGPSKILETVDIEPDDDDLSECDVNKLCYNARRTGPLGHKVFEHKMIQLEMFQYGPEIMTLFTSVKQLLSVRLVDVENMTNELLHALAAHSPTLTCLRILSCGEQYDCVGVKAILTSCKQLEVFALQSCSHLECDDLVGLFTHKTSWALTDLEISIHDTLYAECLRGILLANPQLEILRCDHCHQVSNWEEKELADDFDISVELGHMMQQISDMRC